MEPTTGKVKIVWSMTERGSRTHWARIGVAWESRDGVLHARLDALPINGRICIRPWVEPELKPEQPS